MRCHYCFYRDEQQKRSTSEDCMMTLQTAETLIRRCFAELDQGGFVSFAFQGGEPTLAGLDFFRFFTQTVRKYNQKRVTVQYAIQTNGLAVAEEWARFFREENFLVGISLDGTPDVHDALRPDASGDGTWARVMQTIELLQKNGLLGQSAMVCNCGLPNEKVYPTLTGLDPAQDAGYFATILVKER